MSDKVDAYIAGLDGWQAQSAQLLRREILAGCTTFLTMSAILFVNPDILAQAGIDHGAAFVATCLAAAIGSLIMGLLANYPIGQAPGMGINAFFTFGLGGRRGLGLGGFGFGRFGLLEFGGDVFQRLAIGADRRRHRRTSAQSV